MNLRILSLTLWLGIVPVVLWMATDAADAGASQKIKQSPRLTRCFRDTELSESLATLRRGSGGEVAKVYELLLTKARTAPRCHAEIVHQLMRAMKQANDTTNQIENYFLWENGASLLAQLNATEALDLLISNINLTDGWSASVSKSHTPALVAILRIGEPAIPKLRIVLTTDSLLHRRQFAAFAIAYIGGVQAKRALTSALPDETDPCIRNFIGMSLQAFENKGKPNHISAAQNGKWISAFYCL